MTPERWQQLRVLYNAALDMPLDEREQWLLSACPDPQVRGELDSLLSAGAADATLLDDEPMALPAVTDAVNDLVEKRLGDFKVLQQIGSGGMGTVYLAERADGEFAQVVAIKVVQKGLASEQGLRRFLRERQILGRLNHRHICKILGGGVTADGRPYLVMPFLEGALPLDEYCRRHDLELRSRLQLFLAVCEAVQHAHQNLVVHSDLKPPNILVDAEGVVQLVDFGIARLLDSGPCGQTTMLEGERPLTPQYASPEQIEGASPTTLSDVYSLGVVLYGLIAEQPPFEFKNTTLREISALLATTDPLPPSKRKSGVPADLDNVVLKAMARDADRRYLSASALGDDLQRWLEGQPVQAKAASWRYQFGKFIRRHRWPVSTAVVAVLGLIGLAVVLLVSNRQISAQAVQLQHEKERAESIALFWSDLFEETDPVRAEEAATSTKDLLDKAAARLAVATELGRQTQARLLSVISTAYWNLAETETALKVANQAVALYQDDDPPSEAMVIAFKQLANIAMVLAELDIARGAAEKALSVLDQLPHSEPSLRAHVLDALALVLSEQSELPAAAEALEEAVALQALIDEPDIDIERATAMGNLGYIYFRMSAAPGPESAAYEARAGELVAEASALLLKALGPAHPRVSFMLNAAGVLSRARGDYDQASRYFDQASEIADRALPAEHDFHYTLRYNQGQVLLLQGEPQAAAEVFDKALARALLGLPDGHPDRMSLAQGLGQAAAELSDDAGVERALRQLRDDLAQTQAEVPIIPLWVQAFELRLQKSAAEAQQVKVLQEAAAESGDRQLIAFAGALDE